ncbi:hypothetical protein ACFV0B_06765 [Streptomyces xanthophaeus]|uniref:hypothetical protein n=1 Tax=Streptomyces xanthophaeus TaxID=67385 RepID=UPI0036C8E08E
MTTTAQTDLDRATRAEPRLQAVVNIVTALTALVRPTDTMCGGCVWDEIVKPLALPLIGWERGYPPKVAPDPGTATWLLITGGDWAKKWEEAEKTRTPATTDTEKWLRTSEAWDSVCGELIRRLNDADPANGHGIHHNRKTP